MSVGTILSRLTGFGRQFAIAAALGVSLASSGAIPIASSYAVSNNIPNMIYELVAGGVLSSMFIPIFLERLNEEGESKAFHMTSTLFSLFLVVMGAVAVIGTFFPQPFVLTQLFTKSAADRELAVYLFRFFAVQIIFYAFMALTTGVLNSCRRFFAPMLAPAFNNIVVIVVLLGFYLPLRESNPALAIIALAVGTTLGVLVMLLAQVPALMGTGFRWRWNLDLNDPYLRKMLRKGAWLLAYVAVNLVGVSFRNAFAASAMPDGPITLQYAWMWYQLPYGVLAVSYITAVFPELSESAAKRDWSAYKTYLSRSLRAVSLLMLPSAALLLSLGTPLVYLYRVGSFPAGAVPLVRWVLAGWALGLFSFATYMLVLRAFYATQDTKTPALTNAVLTIVQVGLYAALPKLIGGRFALVGIPLADAAFFTLHVAVLLWILRKRIGSFDFAHVLGGWARSLAAAVVAGVVAWAVMLAASGLGAGMAANFGRVAVGGALGLVAAYATMRALKITEVSYIDGLLARIGRKLVPARRA
jgi:putative peptidoglycan lipid II flippase